MLCFIMYCIIHLKESCRKRIVSDWCYLENDMIIFNVKIASIIVLVLSCFALLFIRGRKYRAIRLIECGLFAGSVLTFIIKNIMRYDIVQYIPENSGAYRDFIISFIKKGFYQGNYIFAIGLLLVVLLNIINRYFKKQVI